MNEQIAALIIEREGYMRRGLKDRVKQVDAVLDALGYKAPRSDKSQVETAAVEHDVESASVSKRARRAGN